MEKPSTRTSFSRGRGHSSRVSTYSEYSHTLRRPFAIQVWATETTGTFAVLDVLGARGTWQQGKNWKNATSYCTSCHMNFMTEKISWNLSSTVQHIRVDFLYSFTLDALLAGFRKPCFSFMNLSWWTFSLLRSPGKDWWSHAQLCLVTSGHCGNVAAQLCMQASLDLWLVPFSCRRRALVFSPVTAFGPGVGPVISIPESYSIWKGIECYVWLEQETRDAGISQWIPNGDHDHPWSLITDRPLLALGAVPKIKPTRNDKNRCGTQDEVLWLADWWLLSYSTLGSAMWCCERTDILFSKLTK